MAESLLGRLCKELECPICRGIMKDPMIIGSCYHVFCKDCLQNHITKGTSDTFACPKCRVEYAVPTDGVEGLKGDFRTANLLEILFKADQGKPINPKHPCSECGGKDNEQVVCEMAEFLCDTCDLDLCPGCRHDHCKAPGFADHIIYDLCSTHWRKMKHFCRSCSMVMCGLCMKSGHPGETHEMVLYKDSFQEEISNIIEKIGKTLSRATLKNDAAVGGEREMKKKVESRRNAVADSANAIVQSSNSEITELQNQIKEMQAKVIKLEKRVARIIARKNQFDEAENEAVDDYHKSVSNFEEVLSDLMSELHRSSERMQQLKTTYCLGGSHNASVIVCKEEIGRLTVSIEETLRAQPKQRTLVPVPTLHEEFKEFTEAKQFKEWTFKDDNKRIFSIEILPEGSGVAVLCGTSSLRSAFASRICLSPSLEFNDIKVISDGITLGVDMTVTSNGDLILLRRAQPLVLNRYRYDHDYLKVEKINLFSDIENAKAIAFDESKNLFFVLFTKLFGPEAEIILFDGSNGSILKSVDCEDSGRLACDSFRQKVFKCYRGVESYGETTLDYSNSWDVPKVDIVDLNWSSDCLYAAGRRLPSHDIVLYRIGSDEKIRPIGPLLDGNGQQVVCDQPCNPRSAVHGDLLLVGVGSRIIFYRLV